jgi:hypothetical protein
MSRFIGTGLTPTPAEVHGLSAMAVALRGGTGDPHSLQWLGQAVECRGLLRVDNVNGALVVARPPTVDLGSHGRADQSLLRSFRLHHCPWIAIRRRLMSAGTAGVLDQRLEPNRTAVQALDHSYKSAMN